MAFSEAIRKKVRRKANFRCCRCTEIGIDVHHIVPSADGGPNTMANAAPLCQNCHDRFGDNPRKRKEIKEMRDRWYEVVAEKWPTPDSAEERINAAMVDDPSDLPGATDELRERLEQLEGRLEDDPSRETIREATTGLVTATRLGESVYANVHCHRCGTQIGMSIGSDACPKCGSPYPA